MINIQKLAEDLNKITNTDEFDVIGSDATITLNNRGDNK